MQPKDSPASPCPKCGNAASRLLSTRPQYSLADPKHPIGMLAVYECECGAGFTAEELLPKCYLRPSAEPLPGEDAERTLLNLSY
jgi:hypothetical protein